MVIALDFASRRVIETSQEDARLRQKLLEESIEHLKRAEATYKNIQKQAERSTTKSLSQVFISIFIFFRALISASFSV